MGLTSKNDEFYFFSFLFTEEWDLIVEDRDKAKYALPLDDFNYTINTLMQKIQEGQLDKALHFNPDLLMYIEVETMNKVIVEKFKQIKKPFTMVPKENTTKTSPNNQPQQKQG